jgi:uncharacterized protein (TIGR03118 family)
VKTKTGLAFCLALLSPTALVAGTLFQVNNLVSDQDGIAATTDPDLINAWGVAQGGPAGPLWISDNGSGKSTVYDHAGEKRSLTVTIPKGAPTGVTFVKPDPNGTTIFPIAKGKAAASSVFVFATKGGHIDGWSQNVDATSAVVAVDNSKIGAVYTGLAISNGDHELFVANFRRNRIEVYDKNFTLLNTFRDKDLPAHFAPFNVMVDSGDVYVAFAEGVKGGGEVKGTGLGYIDIFRRDGHLKTRLVANGALNAPWGMAIAPSTFGDFAGALLVGNFGDGRINAYDRTIGTFMGTLSQSDGTPIVIDGLWGIEARPLGRITFASGPSGETHGLMGSITPATQE